MSYLSPDLTGESLLHKVTNEVRTIFQTTQVVNFNTTVFAESITASMIATISGIKATPLTSGTDFKVNESDIDYDAMGRMKVADPTFNKILCKSVTVYSTTLDYQVNFTYQRLYPNQIRSAYYNGEPLNFTPELLSHILQSIEHIELQIADVQDGSSVSDNEVKIFELDIHMENTDNKVEDEAHELNASSGKIYIHPVGGSYFEESLVVKHPATGATLVKDQDYRCDGLNIHKTIMTSRTKAVYDFIIFLIPITGEVTIDYHAFGGDPTLYDIKNLKIQYQNIISYLNDAAFVTETTLDNTKSITTLKERIGVLEEQMRKFCIQGKPSYGDATDSKVILKKLHASGDNGLHWWTFAKLYQVAGATDIITADRMKVRMATKYTKFMFDATISVNLNNSNGDIFNVVIDNDNYPRGYTPLEDYSGIDNLIRPQFRAIWNANSTEQSGVLLQFGMELKSVATESLVIVDNSGTQSCFIMDDEVDDILLPNDDIVQLPNTNHVWDLSNLNSVHESTLLPFSKGHLVWAGVKPLNRPTGDAQVFLLENHFLDSLVDYKRIKMVRLEMAEVGTPYQFPIDIPFIPNKDYLVGFNTFYYDLMPAFINIKIYRDDNGDIQFDFATKVSSGLDSNQLDIRGVVIYV